MASGGKLERGSSSRKGGSTLQKIAQKKEQLKLYPRIKKVERIATHLHCEVGSYWKIARLQLIGAVSTTAIGVKIFNRQILALTA